MNLDGGAQLPCRRFQETLASISAFVRASGAGLLMPRLAVIGDADLDESVALALDAIDEEYWKLSRQLHLSLLLNVEGPALTFVKAAQ